MLFQSTLPARGATITTAGRATPVIFQSTLPARGATNPPDEGPVARAISIHAPRTGSDGRRERPKTATKRFQSTLPARGATEPPARASSRQQFQSTLPARGATVAHPVTTERLIYFNPRSPHGERHPQGNLSYLMGVFQSTLPARGATRTRPFPRTNSR